MSDRPVDENGQAVIKLPTPTNRPGTLTVDGDIYDDGPVAFLSFDLKSEPARYTYTVPAAELDFGTFRVGMQAVGEMHGSVVLKEKQVRELVAALLWQIEEAANEPS